MIVSFFGVGMFVKCHISAKLNFWFLLAIFVTPVQFFVVIPNLLLKNFCPKECSPFYKGDTRGDVVLQRYCLAYSCVKMHLE